MTVKVKFKNEKQVLKAMRENPQVFARNFGKTMKQIGSIALSESLRRAPAQTGRLRNSLNLEVKDLTATVSPDFGSKKELEYARYVHDGTGIYGPKKRPIRPKRSKVLRFKGKDGKYVHVRQIKGQRPQPFFTEAEPTVRVRALQLMERTIKRTINELSKS